MRILNVATAFLASVTFLAGLTAWGQQTPRTAATAPASIDLALAYAPERTEIVPGQCCFWMQGGEVEGAATFWKGLGVASAFMEGHASNYVSGIDVNKIAYVGGPRYTYSVWAGRAGAASAPRLQIFGQGLFGGVHGFAGVYQAARRLYRAPTVSSC